VLWSYQLLAIESCFGFFYCYLMQKVWVYAWIFIEKLRTKILDNFLLNNILTVLAYWLGPTVKISALHLRVFLVTSCIITNQTLKSVFKLITKGHRGGVKLFVLLPQLLSIPIIVRLLALRFVSLTGFTSVCFRFNTRKSIIISLQLRFILCKWLSEYTSISLRLGTTTAV
jgi:hypothetical protein